MFSWPFGWGPWIPASTTTTTTTRAPTSSIIPLNSTRSPSTSGSSSRELNIVGTVAAIALCMIFAAAFVATALCLRNVYMKRRKESRQRPLPSAAVGTTGSATGYSLQPRQLSGQEWRHVYKGVPIYPTTQMQDGEEVAFVSELEDLPEAAAASMPRFRPRMPASQPPAAPAASNPLNPATAMSSADAEACVGVLVPDLSEEDQTRAAGRWYRQRDYGSAVYYSEPPRVAENTALAMTDLE